MQNTANIQKEVSKVLKKLPLEKQQEVLDFVKLLRTQISPKKRRSRRGLASTLTEAKINMNEENKQNAQNRIIQAMAHLEKNGGNLPSLVGQRMELLRTTTKELFGIAISDVTLKKPHNLPHWHPKHQVKEPELSAEIITSPPLPQKG